MGKPSREKGARRERNLAKIMGGKRGPAYSGEPDVETHTYCVELKSRKTMPKYLWEATLAAMKKAMKRGKAPLVVLEYCEKGHESVRWYCHIGDDEWLDIHGDGGVERLDG